MGEKSNAYRILVGKPDGKRPLGRKCWKFLRGCTIDSSSRRPQLRK
jgi:hypothetical protein